MRARSIERDEMWRSVQQIGGHRVGVTTVGEGQPLVLLHGIGRDRRDWSEVLPALARRWRVYALDIEGFGESAAWGERVTLRSMAAMVRRTLVELGETRPVVAIGNSMGGAVALQLHADDPRGVAALVLAAPAGFGAEAATGLRLMTLPAVGPALLALAGPAARVQVRSMFTDSSLATRELAAESAERLRRPEARRRYLEVVHDLGAWRGMRPEWRAEVLRALAAAGTPALVLWGERDAVLPHAHLAAAAAAVPHATTRSLSGIGHAPQLEDPPGFVAEVSAFLDDRLGAGAGAGAVTGAVSPARHAASAPGESPRA